MKLSERKRKDLRPTPAGDCVYFWLDDIEELEKLETQFEAELKAVKNDYERIKQLEAEKAQAGASLDEYNRRYTELKAELKATYELLDVYEKENERLMGVLTRDGQLVAIHFEMWADSIRDDNGYSGGNLEVYIRSIADALKEGG